MVIDRMRGHNDTAGRRDRGQLLLVGAVAIAALLVGLVVVFNSALFTETVDQESAIQSSNNAVEFVTQTERDLRALAVRVNHARSYDDDSTVNASLQGNVTGYNVVLTEAYADASATYVNVSYHPDDSVNGRRIVQDADGEFTDPGGPPGADDWTPVGTGVSSHAPVGWLVVNLNTSELSLFDEFSVRLTNDTGEYYEASFQRNATGSVVVRTNVSANHAANGTVTCRPVSGRLLVDVLAGNVFARDCGFNASSFVDPPYEVRFVGGDHARGKYEIVTRDENAVDGDVNSCSPPSPGSPCESRAVWSVNSTIVYRSSQVAFRKNVTVEVYNETD